MVKSERAAQVNVSIIRAFIQMRQIVEKVDETSGKVDEFSERIDKLEYKLDRVLAYVEQRPTQPQFLLSKSHERRFASEVSAVQKAVVDYFSLKPQDLKTGKRSGSIPLGRQIAMYLIREKTALGFREIGSFFGGKNHTTVLHAYRKIRDAVEQNTDIRRAVESIQRAAWGKESHSDLSASII